MTLKKKKITKILGMAVFLAAAPAFAQTESSQTGAGSSTAETQSVDPTALPVRVKDVETLLDEKDKLANQKVSVKGEVEDKIDSKSFVLEGGGIVSDQIVVLMSPQAREKAKNIKENEKLTVVGTVKAVPLVKIREDFSWDLDPKLEVELEDENVFLVAEDILK